MIWFRIFRLKYPLANIRGFCLNGRRIREISKDKLVWYPGHINKGINTLNERIYKSDIIIEIHDARIPFTGRTDILDSYSQVKPRILIYNKCDLIPSSKLDEILNKVNTVYDDRCRPLEVIFTQINHPEKQFDLLKKLSSTIMDHVKNGSKSSVEHYIMVAGIPNVGKSTFINSLRNWNIHNIGFAKERCKKPSRVGKFAGVTKTVSEKILLSDGPPRTYILDSPGIWEPSKENLENVLKMGLCGCLNFESIYGEYVIDYMLYWLNRHGKFKYIEYYNMTEPTDNIIVFLSRVCAARGLVVKQGRNLDDPYKPNISAAINLVFKDFNEGKLGKFVLDDLGEYNRDCQLRASNAWSAPIGALIATKLPKQDFPFVWSNKKNR